MSKTLLTIALAAYLLFAATSLFAAGEASRGEQLAKGCKCHRGELDGWSQEKIIKELKAFKAGTRSNTFMNKKAATLSDQDIQDLAAWFAGR